MSDLSRLSSKELTDELSRRGDMPRCRCGRSKTYIGRWDSDGRTLRCHGCLKVIAECTCNPLIPVRVVQGA